MNGRILIVGAAMLAAACSQPQADSNTTPAEETAATTGAAAPAADAAQAGNPVADAVRQIVERQSGNLIGSAKEMPADKYSFSPTKEQMTFGHLASHVAGDNAFRCSAISGTPAPDATKAAEDASKEALIAAMQASFDYCQQALQGVTDAQLADSVAFFGNRKVTKAMAMIGLTNDLADHYAAAATYLRLNGHLPPTAQKRGGM